MSNTAPEIRRQIPHNPDAEMGLISSLLLSPSASYDVCREIGLEPEWFHEPNMATLFAECCEMVDANRPLDFITLTEQLRNKGMLEQAGGAAFITSLFTFLPTAANCRYYAELVRETHYLRQIILVCTDAASKAYDYIQHGSPEEQLEAIEARVLAIRGSSSDEMEEVSPKDAVMDAMAGIQDLYERRGEISGLSTGFHSIDKMLDGLHPKELIVFAARPSMGKTALSMNIAEHVAVDLKKPVLVFSAEMSREQVMQRLLCSRARVDIGRVRNGYLSERDFPAFTMAASSIAESPLYIVDTTSPSIGALKAKARRKHRQLIAEGKGGLALIVIDYLQLCRSTSKRGQENRQLEISEISAGLKALAKELAIPVLVLAQLNRKVDDRPGKAKGRPMLSDLRESGSIEQDADVVGMLMRDEYYATTDEQWQETKGKATLIIAKQRSGPIGDLSLAFENGITRFRDCQVAT